MVSGLQFNPRVVKVQPGPLIPRRRPRLLSASAAGGRGGAVDAVRMRQGAELQALSADILQPDELQNNTFRTT